LRIGRASGSAAGLRSDSPGSLHDGGQLVQGAPQLTFALPAGAAARALAVADHRRRFAHRRLRQVGQFAGDALDGGLCLLTLLRAAQLELAGDRASPTSCGAAPIPGSGAGRATGGLDALHGARDLPDRLGQQTRIGRVGDIGTDHSGVGADPVDAQQLRARRPDQQRVVQRLHRRVPALGGDLHQRGRMRHPRAQRNPTEALPRDRIGHLATQRLIAQPVPELQKHQPQIGLHRNRRAPITGIEMRHERREEHRIVQQRIHPGQLARHHQRLRRQDRVPQRRLVVYSSEHDGLDPF
jgi:hypothetical protein